MSDLKAEEELSVGTPATNEKEQAAAGVPAAETATQDEARTDAGPAAEAPAQVKAPGGERGSEGVPRKSENRGKADNAPIPKRAAQADSEAAGNQRDRFERQARNSRETAAAASYPLSGEALKALEVFNGLDNREKEGFLARAGILALSYRMYRSGGSGVFGLAQNDYSVIFPTITLPARALAEDAARFIAGVQRFFKERENASLYNTPAVAKLLNHHDELWEQAPPHVLVDYLEAIEFEAAYYSMPPRVRSTSRQFQGYKPLPATDDFDAILKHYRAYRRKYRRWERFEFQRYVPRDAQARPTERRRTGNVASASATGNLSNRDRAAQAGNVKDVRTDPPAQVNAQAQPGNGKLNRERGAAQPGNGKADQSRGSARPGRAESPKAAADQEPAAAPKAAAAPKPPRPRRNADAAAETAPAPVTPPDVPPAPPGMDLFT